MRDRTVDLDLIAEWLVLHSKFLRPNIKAFWNDREDRKTSFEYNRNTKFGRPSLVNRKPSN